MEGGLFARYYTIFLPLLWLALVGCSYLRFSRLAASNVIAWVVTGIVTGYVCGLLSFVAMELFTTAGMHVLAQQSRHLEDWMFRLVYPLVSLSWLIGLVSALTALLLNNIVQRLEKPGRP